MSTTPEVKFTVYNLEEFPGKFMMIRIVGEYGTHYMDPSGGWVAIPEDDQDMQDVFTYLKETGSLPQWDLPPKKDAEVADAETVG